MLKVESGQSLGIDLAMDQGIMFRLFVVSAMCFGILSGCATTHKIVEKIHIPHSSDTPMEQVIKAQPDILKNKNSMSVRQVFNNVEQPTAAQIAVIESNFQDDSVAAIRTDYVFKLVEDDWKLQETKKSYQCAREGSSKEFQKELCS